MLSIAPLIIPGPRAIGLGGLNAPSGIHGPLAWAALCVSLLFVLFPLVAPAQSANYSYDLVGRVTRVSYPNGATIDYVYDALGNRLTKATTISGSPSNQPPAAVSNAGIPNGTTNVMLTPNLSWTAATDPNAGDVVAYYVYFGTSPTPPLAFSGWGTNWSPGQLLGLTTD